MIKDKKTWFALVMVFMFFSMAKVSAYDCDFKLERLAKKVHPRTDEWVGRTLIKQGALAKGICPHGVDLWENPQGHQLSQVRGLPVLVTTLINFSMIHAQRDVIALQFPRVDCTEASRDHYLRLIPLRESFQFEAESYFEFPSHTAAVGESNISLLTPAAAIQTHQLEGGTGVEELIFEEGAHFYALTLQCY